MSKESMLAGWELIFQAAEAGAVLFSHDKFTQDFDKACGHIMVLIEDAFMCYERRSFGTSVFLSVTAIEETAKAEIGIYRRDNKNEKQNRKKDPLYNHLSKHKMAVLPTVFMGKRLLEALGEKRCQELYSEVINGSLRTLREEALYFSNKDGSLITPDELIDREKSKEMLLLAIETIDDRLIGYSDKTYDIEKRLSQLFEHVLKQSLDD